MQRWDEESKLWLFPAYLYPIIPNGLEVVAIDGTKEIWNGKQDDDCRFGALAYGLILDERKMNEEKMIQIAMTWENYNKYHQQYGISENASSQEACKKLEEALKNILKVDTVYSGEFLQYEAFVFNVPFKEEMKGISLEGTGFDYVVL